MFFLELSCTRPAAPAAAALYVSYFSYLKTSLTFPFEYSSSFLLDDSTCKKTLATLAAGEEKKNLAFYTESAVDRVEGNKEGSRRREGFACQYFQLLSAASSSCRALQSASSRVQLVAPLRHGMR